MSLTHVIFSLQNQQLDHLLPIILDRYEHHIHTFFSLEWLPQRGESCGGERRVRGQPRHQRAEEHRQHMFHELCDTGGIMSWAVDITSSRIDNR